MPAASPIEPIDPAVERPAWSVMIPVHNGATLLGHALTSVLDEIGDRGDVQIEVVDDCSSDDPEAVVRTIGGGRVGYSRLDSPHGAAGAFNACLRRSRGRHVHLLHCDDAVLPGFYRAMEAALDRPGVAAAVCRARYVDGAGDALGDTRSERRGSGAWDDAVATLAVSNRVRPAAIAVERGAYEAVGGFREDLPHAADWEMWMRLAAHDRLWFVDDVLAVYRTHAASDTAARVLSGANVVERITAIDLVARFVPIADRTRRRRQAFAYSAAYALRTAARCLRRGGLRAAGRQTRAAACCVRLAIVPPPLR